MAGVNLWHSGHVARWHNNPNHALRNSQDTTWQHGARCAWLMWHLWPDSDARMIVAALMHDAHECVTGDTPWGVNKSEWQIEAEAAFNDDHGIPLVIDARLKLVDRLDAYLWARSVDEWIVHAPEWREQIDGVVKTAYEFGVGDKVMELIEDD